MSFRLLIFILTVYLPLALLSACTEAPKPMSMPPAMVQVAPVGVGPFKEKSNYLGTLKSRKSVTLSPRIEGNVVEILVSAGQLVQAGSKVMRIDSGMQAAQMDAADSAADSVHSDLFTAKATLSSLQSVLRSKQANVEFTRAQHDRYHNLQNQGAVSQSELDSWKNNFASAQADLDATLQQIEAQKMTVQKFENNHKQSLSNLKAQREQLKYYEIIAPYTGVIGDIPVKVGDHVTSASALTTITENHPLEVYVSIPSEKAGAITPGMNINLFATDGKQYGESHVIFISPTVDSNSQTVLVKALYPNSKSELRANQTVNAEIVWQVSVGITVPTQAVTQAAGKYFVFVAEQGKDGKMFARQAEIETIGIEGSSYQVSGLKPGDKIVTTGIQRLGDGAPIVPKASIIESGESTAHSGQSTH